MWQNNKTIPLNVGGVVLLSCSNMTIQNLNLTNRKQGMLLLGVTDSLITRNVIANNDVGIILKGSSNNTESQNLITNNSKGIYIQHQTQTCSKATNRLNTNLALHLVNTLLLLLVLARMTGNFWRSTFVAAIFALHPLHVESVAPYGG
jgi:parallel beta-helix repeat protein